MRQKVKINITVHDIGSEGVHAFAPAFIAGLPLWLLIDTGASKSVLDIDFIKTKLPYIPLEASLETAHGFNHDAQILSARLPDIHFNGVALEAPVVHTLDLSYVNSLYQKLGFPAIQGIIGSDWLKRCKAIIDLGDSTLKMKIPVKEDDNAFEEDFVITITSPGD